MAGNTASPRRSIRLHLAAGVSMSVLAAVGAGGWAATTQIAGAVVANGTVIVDSNVKKVQHQTGGIVAEIRVHEGEHVLAGDVLVRLDDTQLRATYGIVTKDLDGLLAQQARLEAEREGGAKLVFAPTLLARASDPDVAKVMASEQRLFDLRRSSQAGQKAQLRQRIDQMKNQIKGMAGQIDAKTREIALIAKEIETDRALVRDNLLPQTILTQMERDAARADGDRGQLVDAIAQAQGKIAETELQILQVDQDTRTQVGKELADVQAKISEQSQRKLASEDQLSRVEIRAPLDGWVHELTAHTVGGIIAAGESIMQIVPDSDMLAVEAKVAPNDIDQTRVGQPATLRFSSFNLQSTPELNGQVSLVSADLTREERTGASYYTIRIALAPAEVARLGSLKLVPGMPVEAFLGTGDRTALSFLLKPLRDRAAGAFRED